MRIDFDDRLDTTFPKEAECAVNDNDCEFKPVQAVCHQCGKELCGECGVGVRHQPQLIKYTYQTPDDQERIQMHCPDCAQVHSWNVMYLGGGAVAVVVGLAMLSTGGAILALGLLAILVGGFLLRNEYRLKKKLDDQPV